MALVLSPSPALHPMTTSILLRPLPNPSPSPSPSPASTPLPALQTDLSSSSSSSTSGSCLDLHRSFSAPSSRRIRFAPLPDTRRDFLDIPDSEPDDPQSDAKLSPQTLPATDDLHNGSLALSPSVSPDSTLSSARSTPTIRTSPNASSKNTSKSNLRILRPFSFLRRANASSINSSPLSQSASLPGSRDPSPSPLARSFSSVPNSPSFRSTKLHISTEDILTFGAASFFRARSGSTSSTRIPPTSSPSLKPSGPTEHLYRSASTGSGPGMKLGNGKRDWGENSGQSHGTTVIAGSGPKKRRASSSASIPGAGGGRHASSVKVTPGDSSVSPKSPSSQSVTPAKKRVKMLNGRIYGGKRYAAQTLANPFASARDEPEFVEWGYGGMGSVHASAGIANDMWKGLQRSERGGALLAGSSFGSPSASSPHSTTGAATVGGGRGTGAHATSSIARRRMSDNVPECSMGNVVAGAGPGDDDGSGMGWVKRRREAKARLEQQAKELEKNALEGRKSIDSVDASMYACTASTTTSLTACTSTPSTDLTTPTTSPLASGSSSVTDLKLTSSSCLESHDLVAAPLIATGEQPSKPDVPAHPVAASKDEHEHHVLTAVRLSPNISSSCHKHSHSVAQGRTPSLAHALSQIGKGTDDEGTEQIPPLSPVDTEETTTSTNSSGEEEEPSRDSNEEQEQDDVDDDEEDEAQDVRRKTALGAGVEKISRHVDVETR